MKEILENYIRCSEEWDRARAAYDDSAKTLIKLAGDNVYVLGNKAVLVLDDRIIVHDVVRLR